MLFKLQSIRFILVGTATALIYYALLYVLVESYSSAIIVASSIAYVVAILFNYIMHYQWTFNSDSPHKVAIVRFILMNTGGFFINLAIMSYGISLFSEYYLVVQAIAMAVIVVWNFIISSLWVYKHGTNKTLDLEE